MSKEALNLPEICKNENHKWVNSSVAVFDGDPIPILSTPLSDGSPACCGDCFQVRGGKYGDRDADLSAAFIYMSGFD